MRRAVIGAVAAVGLALGIVVALLGWSPRAAHQPTGVDWIVQAMVLLIAAVLVVSRATGKR
jgi:Na+/melibiose symporter-like transporter